jgi:hypothetical protein
MTFRNLRLAAPLSLIPLAIGPTLHAPAGAGAAAQQAPAFLGHEVRVGLASPSPDGVWDALHVSYDLDLGYLRREARPFRPFVGLHRMSVRVDAAPDAVDTEPGSPTRAVVTGPRAGLRLEPFGAARVAPRLTAAATASRFRADRPAAAGSGGTRWGVVAGGGLRLGLDPRQRWSAVAEAQHLFMEGANHWSFAVGLRYVPLGRLAYGPLGA